MCYPVSRLTITEGHAMRALLLAAALAVGSGDGRDGATDGRMVKEVPPYRLLRVGMTYEDVKKLLGKLHHGFVADGYFTMYFKVGPDRLGTYYKVVVLSEHLNNVINFTVDVWDETDPDLNR
jgi:hypothetical protein